MAQAKKDGEQLTKLNEKLDYLISYVTGPSLRADLAQDFPTKDLFDRRFDQILTILDTQAKLLTTLDQERIFQIHRVDRLEKELSKIKAHLGLK